MSNHITPVVVKGTAADVLSGLRSGSVALINNDVPYNTGNVESKVPSYTRSLAMQAKNWVNFKAGWDKIGDNNSAALVELSALVEAAVKAELPNICPEALAGILGRVAAEPVMTVPDYLKFTLDWLEPARDALEDTGNILIWGTLAHNLHHVRYAVDMLGLWTVQSMYWTKTNPFPNLAGTNFTSSTEVVLWVRKSRRKKSYYDKTVAERYNFVTYRHACGKCGSEAWALLGTPLFCGNHTDKNGETEPRQMKPTGDGKRIKNLRDYFLLPAETWVGNDWNHPSRKPIALTKLLIDALTPKGRPVTIVDAFAGSGTTGVSAMQVPGLTGEVLLSDNNADYVKNLLAKRMFQGQYPLARINKPEELEDAGYIELREW